MGRMKNMSNGFWKEIHGFTSLGEYNRFVNYIDELIESGDIEEITPNPDYGFGEIYGGRWIKKVKSNEIWRLIPPDFPFKGLWEPVGKYDL
jgi:hypothetical protein